jgi:hypothetical protein
MQQAILDILEVRLGPEAKDLAARLKAIAFERLNEKLGRVAPGERSPRATRPNFARDFSHRARWSVVSPASESCSNRVSMMAMISPDGGGRVRRRSKCSLGRTERIGSAGPGRGARALGPAAARPVHPDWSRASRSGPTAG